VSAYLFKPKNDGEAQKKDARKKEVLKNFGVSGNCIALIGSYGSGTNHLILESLHHIDSPRTLIVDPDGGFTKIQQSFLPTSKIWTDQNPTKLIPTSMMIENDFLIINDAFEAIKKYSQLEEIIDFASKGTIILLLRNKDELKIFGLDASKAEISMENIGPSDRKEQQVNGYVFNGIPKRCRFTPHEQIGQLITEDYVDDVFTVYRTSKSLDTALKAGVLAEYLEREPSIIARSKNFEKAYHMAETLSFIDSETNKDALIAILSGRSTKEETRG
jgi:hypothetical protein